MGFSDLIHGLFVLGAVASYALPLQEAIKRKSWYLICLFGSIAVLSFFMHCEHTGFCVKLSEETEAELEIVDKGLTLYIFSIMLLVVLEIRQEVLGRIVFAVLAFLLSVRDPQAGANFTNITVTLIAAAVLFLYDIKQHPRRFSQAWAKRMTLIAVLAAGGALLFKLLKAFWVAHGIWHLYTGVTVYLLLVAQREKANVVQLNKASRVAAAGGSSSSGGGLTGSSSGGGAGGSIGTPFKRRGPSELAQAGHHGDADLSEPSADGVLEV